MQLSVPPELTAEEREFLRQAFIAGSPEVAGGTGTVNLNGDLLKISRDIDESGALTVPWRVKGAGQLLLSTATLIEQAKPYQLPLELARGKVNQVRCQTADWAMNGLQLAPALSQRIKDATRAFTRAVARQDSAECASHANQSLTLAFEAADELIHNYTQQVFHFRQQNEPALNTVLACPISHVPPDAEIESAIRKSFNGISIPFCIRGDSSFQDKQQWDACDGIMDWARNQNVPVSGGPLVNYSLNSMPTWLALYEKDRNGLAGALCDYVSSAVARYTEDIQSWQITAASNLPNAFDLSDEELLWLTLQIGEAARRAAPKIELTIGISQPWGEYLHKGHHDYSPFIFADTMLRSGLSISAIDLEIVMGVSPTGSYCRDLLEFSRLLDLYALLGVPLDGTLGYPADNGEDSLAEDGLATDYGVWRDGHTPQIQSDWAAEFTSLAICKPYVRKVKWTHLSDGVPHVYPNCGLIGADGNPRPVLPRLQKIREKYLK